MSRESLSVPTVSQFMSNLQDKLGNYDLLLLALDCPGPAKAWLCEKLSSGLSSRAQIIR